MTDEQVVQYLTQNGWTEEEARWLTQDEKARKSFVVASARFNVAMQELGRTVLKAFGR